MEARMHPLITREIIGLFNSLETNPKRAQLIFTTHDTNLLSKDTFRRDQIWFIEKDSLGASHLYSLAELKVRNDASFETDYVQGRYGAIPFLGDLRRVVVCEDDEN
jgi:AAA15 family ATPase/GTPase